MANEGKFNADLDMGLNITVDSSALTDLTKTIKEIAKGKDLQRYWSDVESATERATKAAKRYSDRQNSKGAASNFLKNFNALKAMVGGKNISELFPELDVNELLKNAKQIAPEINSAFSVDIFSQAFKAFDVLKEKGYDLEEVFSKLADYVNLRKENFDLSRENFNYKDLLGDRDIEQLDNQVKEIKKLRNQAEDTFTKFLDINNISTTDYFGEDRFTEYFEGIRNGTMTASDAIKKFKERYDYLLEDNFRLSGDSFGIDQLQAFSEKLESIFLQVQETSNKINDIISNGIITKSVSDLSNDSSITSTQRSLFGNLLEDEESLKSITSLFQKLIEETNKTSNTQLFDTEQFTKITSLFETIKSHLSSLRKVISDVGDGDEFSPLLSTIKEINSAIDSLNNTVKNTNFGTSLNLDFGDIGGKYDEQLSKAQRRKMLAYKKLFEDMRSTGKVTKESWKFVEPEGLSDDELSGIYKQMIEREKTVRGSNVFKRVIDENSKEIKNAQAAVNRARKNTENNNNLQEILGFEKTDLTGVISQLETIANKLDTIASSAKTMGEAFSSGLNVSTSFEEITKLTERVKELEAELQKVKSVGGISGNKTGLSSGGSKAAEAQAKAKAKRQEQLAKAKAAALSKSRQNAKNETQTSVNNAVKKQLESWREIQKIRLQMSKTTDTGELSRLEAMKKVEQERYLDATKILNVNRELYDYEAQSYKLQKASKDTTNAIANNQAKEQAKAAEAQAKAIRDQKSSVDSMVSSSQRLVNGFSHKNNVHPSDKYVETVKKATDALKEMENIQKKIENDQNGVATEDQIEDLKKYEEEIKKCKEEISKMSAAEKGSTDEKATKEIKKIYEALEKNSRMSSEAKAQLHGYITELKNNPSANVEEIATAWKKVVIAEKEAGRGGKSLLSAVGEKAFYGLAGQIAGMVSLWDVINVIKQAASEVTQLNTDITDLAKVSEQSVKQIYSDFSSYADIAKEMGGTISDTITATTAWAKNGYSIPDSKELARVSLLYKNVGDDITIDEANESLVSTLQGYKLAADDAEHIIDVFNEVSNNEAISSAGIGEALQRSAASFNAANTSLEQSVALVSATNSVLQDPEKVGGTYIADLYSNVMKIKVAISVNVQRWIRPSKDLYVFI